MPHYVVFHLALHCFLTFSFSHVYTKGLLHIVGWESKTCIFDFHIFQERQKTEYLLLGVSYIAESQTGLYLVTSKFTIISVLNFH